LRWVAMASASGRFELPAKIFIRLLSMSALAFLEATHAQLSGVSTNIAVLVSIWLLVAQALLPFR
jgi:hypothetical protein